MDISLLLELPAWLEDECELDILSISRDATNSCNGTTEKDSVPSFLVIQSAGDKQNQQGLPGSPQQPGPAGIAVQSGRGASVVSHNYCSFFSKYLFY